MTYQKFRYKALHNQCRECINRYYGLELTPNDCQYWSYPGMCSGCGGVRNIVIGIAPLSRWKIWRINENRLGKRR